jgi:hypothetical protein
LTSLAGGGARLCSLAEGIGTDEANALLDKVHNVRAAS